MDGWEGVHKWHRQSVRAQLNLRVAEYRALAPTDSWLSSYGNVFGNFTPNSSRPSFIQAQISSFSCGGKASCREELKWSDRRQCSVLIAVFLSLSVFLRRGNVIAVQARLDSDGPTGWLAGCGRVGRVGEWVRGRGG